MQAVHFFSDLWKDYIKFTPQALAIHKLFHQIGEQVVNDHVAFRTFADCNYDLLAFEPFILDMGFHAIDDYQFPEKHVSARAYLHPDPTIAKIFISQLHVDQLEEASREILRPVMDLLNSSEPSSINDLHSGRIWSSLSYDEFLHLSAHSEYAAWLAAWGFRANHFTVSVNHLVNLSSIMDINELLRDHCFELNSFGGLVKGSPEVLLEQSSTRASLVACSFSNGVRDIRGGFYEFAKRYPQADGKLFQGFVAANANQIFASTHQ